jgi:tetratricopeptide (TPR) repeat protein
MNYSHRTIRAAQTLLAACLFCFIALVPFVFIPHIFAQQAHAPTDPLAAARQALAAKQFDRAKAGFQAYLEAHPDSVDARLGLADAELALHEYEAAEWDYRRVTDAQPQLWNAHKNLVIVEAALGRWEEFEREREVLRAARERGAPGISARDSDVIDTFDVHGQHWIVREYFQPVGRSETRYNFERFSPEGRVEEFISLEPSAAAAAALAPGDVHIGQDTRQPPPTGEFSLDYYTGKAHGTIARYPHGEPTYERVRADVLRWLHRPK